jgi:hypothetical protein
METRRFPPPWTVEDLDALLCQIESRIKKTPALGLGAVEVLNRACGDVFVRKQIGR